MAGRAVIPDRSSSLASNQIVIAGFLLVVTSLAARFLVHYAFPYFLFDQTYFDRAGYWPHRARLIFHISGGMLALSCGPFQFWTGLRQKAMRIHRWTGRLYLFGVAVGSLGAFLMAVYTQPHNFGIALMGLAIAWIVTSATAYAAIMRGLVQIHKEWMVRSYLVTFAFVTFRLLNDEWPNLLARWGSYDDRVANVTWISWVVPLLAYELILQARRIFGAQQVTSG